MSSQQSRVMRLRSSLLKFVQIYEKWGDSKVVQICTTLKSSKPRSQKIKIPAKTVVKFRVAKAAKEGILGVKK